MKRKNKPKPVYKILQYRDNGYAYFWCPWMQLWAIYNLTKTECLDRDTVNYYPNRKLLKANYSSLEFKPYRP